MILKFPSPLTWVNLRASCRVQNPMGVLIVLVVVVFLVALIFWFGLFFVCGVPKGLVTCVSLYFSCLLFVLAISCLFCEERGDLLIFHWFAVDFPHMDVV